MTGRLGELLNAAEVPESAVAREATVAAAQAALATGPASSVGERVDARWGDGGRYSRGWPVPFAPRATRTAARRSWYAGSIWWGKAEVRESGSAFNGQRSARAHAGWGT